MAAAIITVAIGVFAMFADYSTTQTVFMQGVFVLMTGLGDLARLWWRSAKSAL